MTHRPQSSGSRLAATLGAAALLFLAFAFGLRIFWFGVEPPLPELLQNLPDSRSDADQQLFVERLQKLFFAGAAEADVVSTLRQQGFKLARAPERAATYDRRAGINDKCRRSGNVRWSADADGKVTEVSGGYYQHCP